MAKSLRELAREAKCHLKSGFWNECKEDLDKNILSSREQGINESKVERYFADKITATLNGEKEDEFYLKVKELLLAEGEVSDAIGRLTDVDYYATLSYEEKQRYNLSLSEKYLRALERFRHESQFAVLKTIEK